MEFEIDRIDGSQAVIRPHGRLTMVATSELRALVAETVGGGRNRIVVDLSATDFIDSSGLGALIAGLKTARQAGGDLRIACPTKQVEMVLNLTNLDRVLRAHDKVQDAFGAA